MNGFGVAGALFLIIGFFATASQVVNFAENLYGRSRIRDRRATSLETRRSVRTLLLTVVGVTAFTPGITVITSFAYEDLKGHDPTTGAYILIGLTFGVTFAGLGVTGWLSRANDDSTSRNYAELRRDIADVSRAGALTQHGYREFSDQLRTMRGKVEAEEQRWMTTWVPVVDLASDVEANAAAVVSQNITWRDVMAFVKRRRRRSVVPPIIWLLTALLIAVAVADQGPKHSAIPVLVVSLVGVAIVIGAVTAAYAQARQRLITGLTYASVSARQYADCTRLLDSLAHPDRSPSESDTGAAPLARVQVGPFALTWHRSSGRGVQTHLRRRHQESSPSRRTRTPATSNPTDRS